MKNIKEIDFRKACGVMPESFEQRVRQTLEATGKEPEVKKLSKRVCLLAAAIVLLLTATALAAMNWSALEKLIGGKLPNADQVMQANLYQETVNNVEITIKEAGYDGRTLWLATSYRMLDATAPLGHVSPDEGAPEEWSELLAGHNVGWWMDSMWINGKQIDMPNGSYSIMDGGDAPGEVLVYETWRLDNEEITLRGETEIALPIGDRQSLADYSRQNHPERYGPDGNLNQPDKGMVVFRFTPSTVAVRTETPKIPVTTNLVTAQADEVVYSPIMTYITLKLTVNPDAMADFIAQNGEGETFTDPASGETFTFPYTALDVFGSWVYSLELVDGEGQKVFPNLEEEYGYHYGMDGCGSEAAWFLYPYRETWPDEMYLAPVEDGVADLTQAVRVK